jgi:hypothetical protein
VKPSEEQVSELKTKHGGGLHLIEHEEHAVVVKMPSVGEAKRFRAATADDAKKPAALEVLLRACVVWPDTSGLDAMMAEKPFLVETFGGGLLELAGAAKSPSKKAL